MNLDFSTLTNEQKLALFSTMNDEQKLEFIAQLEAQAKAQAQAEAGPKGEEPPFRLNGALFRDTSERRVDYSGSIKLTHQEISNLLMWFDKVDAAQDTVTLFVTGWSRQSAKDQKYISFVIQPPKEAGKGETGRVEADLL